jgi:Fes/CIP4, and EFC/F-BAR homology domain
MNAEETNVGTSFTSSGNKNEFTQLVQAHKMSHADSLRHILEFLEGDQEGLLGIRNFLKKRADIELEYSKSLNRLVEDYPLQRLQSLHEGPLLDALISKIMTGSSNLSTTYKGKSRSKLLSVAQLRPSQILDSLNMDAQVR